MSSITHTLEILELEHEIRRLRHAIEDALDQVQSDRHEGCLQDVEDILEEALYGNR